MAVVRAAIEALAKGPPLANCPGSRSGRCARALSPLGPWRAQKHEFAECGAKAWRCQHCLRTIYRWQSPIRHEPCGRLPPSVHKLQLHDRTHMLMLCVIDRGPEALIFCEACASYASAEPRGLAQPCPGAARGVVARRRVLNRIAGGLHPKDGDTRRLSASWPVQQGPAAAADSRGGGEGDLP